MKRIPKDLADKMVEDVLTAISKQTDVSSQFAEDSLRIMQDNTDNTVFTGILLTKARPSLFDDNEIDMKLTIMSALQTVFMCGMNKEIGFNKKLAKEFSSDETKCADSTKLDFALNQFVNAFYEYERLENKYPELMKIM
jgi:hypothetical protein